MAMLPRGVAIPAQLDGMALVRAVAPFAPDYPILPVADGGRLIGVLPLAEVMDGL
jgi:hypothetical protein